MPWGLGERLSLKVIDKFCRENFKAAQNSDWNMDFAGSFYDIFQLKF